MAGFGDLTKMLGQVREMQSNMQRMQEELSRRTVEASSGGGMVRVQVNGKGELLSVKIDRNAVDVNDVEMLEDLIKAAVNAAVAKSQQEMKDEMLKVTGGLNLPGLDQLSKMM
jgi:DNA-binding YbaB/EbfC family protein